MAAEIAAGLSFLHAAGVLHLDVKPGNVFVDGAGGLKLGDFGLAVLRHQWVSCDGSVDYPRSTLEVQTRRQDVKPGNVFVDGAGGLKLGDFGLAVLRHQLVSLGAVCFRFCDSHTWM